jgi:tetratricopeptide (TPR) repeat protein
LYWKEPRRLLKYLPTAAVLIAYLWLRMKLTPHIVYHVTTPWVGGGGGGRKMYLLTQFRAWVYYLKLYLWPDPLIFDYSGFGWSRSFLDARVLVSLAIVSAIVIGAWLMRKRDPLLVFGVAWFFIALLPEASVFVRPDEVTGHRPYLAYAGLSIAFVIFIVTAADALRRRLRPTSWPGNRFFAVACGAALAVTIAALTGATLRRNLDWRDDVTLWTDVLEKDPGNIRARNVLGIEYAQRGDYAQARQILDEAIRAKPRSAESYLRRGTVNMLVGDYDAALADLNTALAKQPWLVFGHIYRGDVYRETRRYEDAEKDYQAALRINAMAVDAYYGIALVNWEKKQLPEATAACRKLLDLERDTRGYLCLGSLLMHQSMFNDAMKIYYNGVSRFPENSTLWYGLGTAYEELGLYKEAQHSYERSSQLAQEPEKDSRETK